MFKIWWFSFHFCSLHSGRKDCSIEVSAISCCCRWILNRSGVCFENSEKNHEDVSGCHWNGLGKSIHIFGTLFLQNFEEDDIEKATGSQTLEDKKDGSSIGLRNENISNCCHRMTSHGLHIPLWEQFRLRYQLERFHRRLTCRGMRWSVWARDKQWDQLLRVYLLVYISYSKRPAWRRH